MKKMEQNKQMAQHVIKLNFMLLSFLVFNCHAQRETQFNKDDYNLLNIYITEELIEYRQDSIFLGLDNSNDHILNNFREYLKIKKDSFIKMPNSVAKKINGKIEFVDIVKGDSIYNRLIDNPWVNVEVDSITRVVYADKEYATYERQLTNGKWDDEIFDEIENVYLTKTEANSKEKKKRVFYISKPMYTIDKKHALMYCWVKNGIYPYIHIYENKDGTWLKVHTIEGTNKF